TTISQFDSPLSKTNKFLIVQIVWPFVAPINPRSHVIQGKEGELGRDFVPYSLSRPRAARTNGRSELLIAFAICVEQVLANARHWLAETVKPSRLIELTDFIDL